MNYRRDFRFAAIIGFTVGILIIFPAANLGFKFSFFRMLVSMASFSIFSLLAFVIIAKLSRRWPVLYQIGKFLATGTLNTLMDFGILNALILLTDIARGIYYVVFKIISFIIAGTNSYLWNKYWVFESKIGASASEYSNFLTVTAIGAAINIAIAAFIVNWVGAPHGFNPKVWSNIGALAAVIFSMFWNFISYKFFVFKQKNSPSIEIVESKK